MNRTLTFTDGTTLEFDDCSTIYLLRFLPTKFSEIDDIYNKFSIENLSSCNFDGIDYTDIIPVSIDANKTFNGEILVTIVNRNMSDSEVLARQMQQINELQEAVAELG